MRLTGGISHPGEACEVARLVDGLVDELFGLRDRVGGAVERDLPLRDELTRRGVGSDLDTTARLSLDLSDTLSFTTDY